MPPRPLALLSAMLFLAVPVAAQVSAPTERSPYATGVKSASTLTSTEIKEHNKELDAKHADYIRCRKFTETGSLVRVARVCRTNAQWTDSFRQGNQNARDTQDAMTRAPITRN